MDLALADRTPRPAVIDLNRQHLHPMSFGIVDQHRRVVVEPDVAAVAPSLLLAGPHDDRPDLVAALDVRVRKGLLHGRDDDVTNGGIPPVAAPHDLDGVDTLGFYADWLAVEYVVDAIGDVTVDSIPVLRDAGDSLDFMTFDDRRCRLRGGCPELAYFDVLQPRPGVSGARTDA